MSEREDGGISLPAPSLNVTLGSALFDLERSRDAERAACRTGIKSIDAQFEDLFSGGKVIAIGQIEAEADVEEQSLAAHLIATHLLALHQNQAFLPPASDSESTPSVYILAPPSTTIVSTLHSLLQHRLSLTHNNRPDHASNTSPKGISSSILDAVLLFPSLSLPGLASSLSDVSQRLYEHTSSSQSKPKPKPVVLLIQDLSSMLADMQRRSGSVQTAALLANVLRSLRGLCRSYAWLVVLVEMDVEVGLGSGKGEGGGGGGSGWGGGFESAFSSEKGEVYRIMAGGVVGGLLVDGIDVVVGVHRGFGRAEQAERESNKVKAKTGGSREVKVRIVEMWKDALGGRTGEWCLWEQ